MDYTGKRHGKVESWAYTEHRDKANLRLVLTKVKRFGLEIQRFMKQKCNRSLEFACPAKGFNFNGPNVRMPEKDADRLIDFIKTNEVMDLKLLKRNPWTSDPNSKSDL